MLWMTSRKCGMLYVPFWIEKEMQPATIICVLMRKQHLLSVMLYATKLIGSMDSFTVLVAGLGWVCWTMTQLWPRTQLSLMSRQQQVLFGSTMATIFIGMMMRPFNVSPFSSQHRTSSGCMSSVHQKGDFQAMLGQPFAGLCMESLTPGMVFGLGQFLFGQMVLVAMCATRSSTVVCVVWLRIASMQAHKSGRYFFPNCTVCVGAVGCFSFCAAVRQGGDTCHCLITLLDPSVAELVFRVWEGAHDLRCIGVGVDCLSNNWGTIMGHMVVGC
jgi:hypothetical protein